MTHSHHHVFSCVTLKLSEIQQREKQGLIISFVKTGTWIMDRRVPLLKGKLCSLFVKCLENYMRLFFKEFFIRELVITRQICRKACLLLFFDVSKNTYLIF